MKGNVPWSAGGRVRAIQVVRPFGELSSPDGDGVELCKGGAYWAERSRVRTKNGIPALCVYCGGAGLPCRASSGLRTFVFASCKRTYSRPGRPCPTATLGGEGAAAKLEATVDTQRSTMLKVITTSKISAILCYLLAITGGWKKMASCRSS